ANRPVLFVGTHEFPASATVRWRCELVPRLDSLEPSLRSSTAGSWEVLVCPGLDLYFQKSLNPWRCQRSNVAGWTMTRALCNRRSSTTGPEAIGLRCGAFAEESGAPGRRQAVCGEIGSPQLANCGSAPVTAGPEPCQQRRPAANCKVV